LPCAYDKKKEKYEKESGSHHAKILAKVLSALISPAMPARITRADYRRAGRANYLAPFQTATNSRGLANFLVWFVLAVIQTDPMLLNGCYVRLQRISAQFVSMAGNRGVVGVLMLCSTPVSVIDVRLRVKVIQESATYLWQ
jgi:hypothetical protein